MVSFPVDFLPTVGKSMSDNPLSVSVHDNGNHYLLHVVHCMLTGMQSYMTSHVKLQCANISVDLYGNKIGGLPRRTFPYAGPKVGWE